MKENVSHILSKKVFSTQKISLIERSVIIEKKGNDLSLMKKAASFSWHEIRKKYQWEHKQLFDKTLDLIKIRGPSTFRGVACDDPACSDGSTQ